MGDGEAKAIYGPIDDDLEAEIERLRAALQAIIDYGGQGAVERAQEALDDEQGKLLLGIDPEI